MVYLLTPMESSLCNMFQLQTSWQTSWPKLSPNKTSSRIATNLSKKQQSTTTNVQLRGSVNDRIHLSLGLDICLCLCIIPSVCKLQLNQILTRLDLDTLQLILIGSANQANQFLWQVSLCLGKISVTQPNGAVAFHPQGLKSTPFWVYPLHPDCIC